MFASGKIDLENAKKQTIRIVLDTEHLAPGRYRANIIAYQYNEFGSEQFLDGVYPGFIFDISEELNEKNKINWLPQYWGRVRLHDLDVICPDK